MADCEIHEIEEGKTYREAPSLSNVVLRDLYPRSVTYAQICRGSQVIGTQGSPLPSTVVSYDAAVPQNAELMLSELHAMTQIGGPYTVEILTITPFNGGAPELLESRSFHIKRGISINGMISTMEK
jgi:hypothetical protein